MGFQTKLNSIVLNHNRINIVGEYAFANLPNLTYLALYRNEFGIIKKNAFSLHFEATSDQSLYIELPINKLNNSNFEQGWDSKLRRKAVLWLEGNIFTYIDEKFFGPFLNSTGNIITIWDNPLVCDCNMKWLLESENLFKNSFMSNGVVGDIAYCTDGKQLWVHPPRHLEHCSP